MRGLKYIHLMLFSIASIILLLGVFAINPRLLEGIQPEGIEWIQIGSLLLAGGTIILSVTIRKVPFVFCHADPLFLAIMALEFIFYDSTQNNNPFQLYFLGQLLMIWFMIRCAFQYYPQLRVMFLFGIEWVSVCVVILFLIPQEVFFNHTQILKIGNLDAETNRLLSGYITILVPLSVSGILRFYKCNKGQIWRYYTQYFWMNVICTVSYIYILICTGIILHWIIAAIGALWAVGFRISPFKFKGVKRRNYIIFIIACAGFLIYSLTMYTIDYIKTPEGQRQKLVWELSTKMFIEKPFVGIGLGKYPVNYAEVQKDYFSSLEVPQEKTLLASSPIVAGNGYMQFGIETGVLGSVLFLAWLILSIYIGIKNRQIGSTGMILCIAILAAYKASMQFPTLWVLLVFTSAICVTPSNQKFKGRKYSVPRIGLLCAIVSCVLFFFQYNIATAYKQWYVTKEIYNKKAYRVAMHNYTELYPLLNGEAEFLYEGAMCSKQVGNYDREYKWLRRALQLSSDVKFYYAISDCLMNQNHFYNAEQYLVKSARYMPGRAETFIRLMRLYTNPEYRRALKFNRCYEWLTFLKAHPDSGITVEMVNEAEALKKVLLQAPYK